MGLKELKERQSWTLDQKIDHSLGVIDQFYQRLNGKCYVSFSGGKDSTIVLWLARKIYPNIKGCFCNTGNEYPDIVKFVRTFDNIDWIKPKMKPKQVLEKCGFPLVSKNVSHILGIAKRNPNGVCYHNYILHEKESLYSVPTKWGYLYNEPYMVDSQCCSILKKHPFREYEQNTGLMPILGILASESRLRQKQYIRNGGCNVFDGSQIKSMPLSIWLESDVLECIKKYNIEISEIYKKGLDRTGCMFCGYGCTFKDDNRFKILMTLYPKWYETFMNYTNNGHTYREALRKLLSTNGLNLPDENKELKLEF